MTPVIDSDFGVVTSAETQPAPGYSLGRCGAPVARVEQHGVLGVHCGRKPSEPVACTVQLVRVAQLTFETLVNERVAQVTITGQ